jgi:hypothetical protein
MSMEEVLKEIRQVGLSLVRYDRLRQMTIKHLEVWDHVYNEKYRYPIESEAAFFDHKINELERIGRYLLKELPLWTEWLKDVKGIGPGLTLRLLGYLDFNKAKHPSSFWAYAGYTDTSTKTQKFNHTLKGICIKTAMSILGIRTISPTFIANPEPRRNCGYARFFKMVRRQADNKYPDWTRRHKLFHSMRVMMKKFLVDLFVVYHWLENNVATVHYAVAQLGHDYIYLPVIDKDEKPEWWIKLKEEYKKMGIRPVEV